LHIPANLLLFFCMSLLGTAEVPQSEQNGVRRKRVRVARREETAAEPAPAA
jgi:hypothetical protein